MREMLEATARAEERHFWFRGLRRNAARILGRAVGNRSDLAIVDCGSGTGRNLEWLDQFGRAVGIELTPAGLREGRQAGRRMVRATVAALPLPDESMDVATSFDVLYCLPDDVERRAIEEMWRVLRPDGLVLVNVAALDILHGSHSTLTREVRRYTPSRLRERLVSTGFVIERLTFTNLPALPAALAVRTFERWTRRAGEASDRDLAVPAAPVNVLFDWLLRLEGWWLRVGNVPVGTSLMCLARKPAGDVRRA